MNDQTLTLEDLRNRVVVTIEEAGEVLGISRTSAYRAARKDEIPTLRVGRRLLVPVPELRRMIGDLVDQPA